MFSLAFFIFVLVVNFPNQRVVSEADISIENLDTRRIVLNYPGKIWFGQNEKIKIQILIPKIDPEADQIHQDQSTSSTIENDFEFDLVLNGATIDPPGKLITPIVPNKDFYLTKTIGSQYPGKLKGTIWIHISQSGQSGELSANHRLIYSKEIEITTKNLFGLRFQFLRWLGLFGLGICLLFLFRYSKINEKFQKEQLKES